MATKQEWREYFELINGREPSMQEFSDAIANGEITDARQYAQPQASYNQPMPSQQQPLQPVSQQPQQPTPQQQMPQAPQQSSSINININGTDIQNTAKSYWKWLLEVLKHPISSKTSNMTTANMWITFGLIFGILSLAFAIWSMSFLIFMIFLIVGAGVFLLFAALYGVLANAIMKTHFKFFDIFKMLLQANIFFVPISALVFIFSIFARITMNASVNSFSNGLSSGIYNSSSLSSLVGVGIGLSFFALLIWGLIIFALFLGIEMFIMGLYRETVKYQGNKIDRYPWFVLAFGAIVVAIIIFLILILGAIVGAALSQIHY